MSSAAEIKKKMQEDHVADCFNHGAKKSEKIYGNPKAAPKSETPKYSSQKQPAIKKKESPNLSNHSSYPNQHPKNQYDSLNKSNNNKPKAGPISAPPPTFQGKSKLMQKFDSQPKISDEHKSKPLSAEDKERQKVAISNHEFVNKHPDLVSKNIQTYFNSDHIKIQSQLKPIKSRFENIFVNDRSTIWSAIDLHKRSFKHIYILNFADSLKPGGGYLNGRGAQEETLCRQTLLYPTICDNPIYKDNLKYGAEGSNNMIYSADVLVIRYDDYNFIPQKDQFYVNFISAAAVDNRKQVANIAAIMEDRIRKIISLAAVKSLEEKDQGKNALILGAFGCGVFKNDPDLIASIFAKILHGEKFKQYFNCIIFPIFKDKNGMIPIFKKHLTQIV